MKHKKYYESVLESLEFNADNKGLSSLLDRMKDAISNTDHTHQNLENKPETKTIINCKEIKIKELQKLKKTLVSSKPYVINFRNNENTEFVHNDNIFESLIEERNFKIKVSSFPQKQQKNNVLNLLERDFLILAEIELGFLTEISDSESKLIVDSDLFDKINLLQSLIKRDVISINDYKRCVSYVKQNINSVTLNSFSKESMLSKNKFAKYINLLKSYKLKIINENPNEELSRKIFDSLLPDMKKPYVRELKLITEKKN